MIRNLKIAIQAALLLLAITAGFWWGLLQWFECKEMGHSTFYCVGHVLR